MRAQIGRDACAVLLDGGPRLEPEVHGVQQQQARGPLHEGQQGVPLCSGIHYFHVVGKGIPRIEPFRDPDAEAFIPIEDIAKPQYDDPFHDQPPFPERSSRNPLNMVETSVDLPMISSRMTIYK